MQVWEEMSEVTPLERERKARRSWKLATIILAALLFLTAIYAVKKAVEVTNLQREMAYD